MANATKVAVLFMIVAAWFLSGCATATSRTSQPTGARATLSGARLVALLANRQLVKLAPETGRVTATVRVGRAAPTGTATGAYLALPRSHESFFVLVPYASGERQVVRKVAASDLEILRSYRLPRGIVFRSLQVDGGGGRLYLLGNRGNAQTVGAPVLAVLDARDGRLVTQQTLRAPRGRHWLVFDTALSADGTLLAISYHGPDTTGADWLRLSDLHSRCTDRTPPAIACLSLHGDIAFRGHDVVATTGEGPIVERTLTNRLVRAWPPKLPRNHLTTLVLDPQAQQAAVLGGCDYVGGLSVIPLRSGSTTVIGYPEKICGEKVVFVNDSTVVVARNAMSVPQGTPSRLDLVSLKKRAIVQRTRTSTDVLDIAVIR